MKDYFTDSGEKTKFVQEVFSSVANKYDIMNDVMTLGMQRLWKRHFLNQIDISGNVQYLDIACGSGDIAINICKKLKKQNIDPSQCVTCLDQNADMINIAKSRFIEQNFYRNASQFCVSSAETMPFENETFNVVTVSFGARNFSNLDIAMKEIYRILKPNGKFYCLEFSPKLPSEWLDKIFAMYGKIIPKMGKIITQDELSYQYLIDSIRNFPSKEDFQKIITKAGFDFSDFHEVGVALGVCNVHIGQK